MIWSDKVWICVSLMLSFLRCYSQFESLDEIYVRCSSGLSVLELVSVSFASIAEMWQFRVFKSN